MSVCDDCQLASLSNKPCWIIVGRLRIYKIPLVNIKFVKEGRSALITIHSSRWKKCAGLWKVCLLCVRHSSSSTLFTFLSGSCFYEETENEAFKRFLFNAQDYVSWGKLITFLSLLKFCFQNWWFRELWWTLELEHNWVTRIRSRLCIYSAQQFRADRHVVRFWLESNELDFILNFATTDDYLLVLTTVDQPVWCWWDPNYLLI